MNKLHRIVRVSGIIVSVAFGLVGLEASWFGKPLDAEFLAETAIFILLLVEYCLPKGG